MAKRTKASARKKMAAYHVRDVHVSAIVDAVKKLCIDANLELEPDMLRAFDRALTTERSPAGKQVLQILKDNAQMAKTKRIPYCQDTGFVVCFVELGQDVHRSEEHTSELQSRPHLVCRLLLEKKKT